MILLFTAKYLWIVVALIAAAWWLTRPNVTKVKSAVVGAIAGIVTFALVKLGAAIYYDPRPFVAHNVTPLYPHAPDNGFPSDHTVLTAWIAVSIFMFSKRLGALLFVLSALIGISRVVGHIHSPIDIVGSMIFALIGGAISWYFAPKVMRLWHKKEAPELPPEA